MDNRKIKEVYLDLSLIIPDDDRFIKSWYDKIESKLDTEKKRKLRTKLIANRVCFARFHSPAFNYINFKQIFGFLKEKGENRVNNGKLINKSL